MSLPLSQQLDVLRGATLADGRIVDVVLDGETVAGVVAAGTAAPGANELDLHGHVLLPAAAEPHAHLDKSRTWELANPPFGDLVTAIQQFRAFSATETVASIAARAEQTALEMLAKGFTAIRSHVDLLRGDEPLRGVEALLQVRERLTGLMDIELVALADDQIDTAVFEAALDLGVDLVGGVPHLASDPFVELDRLLTLAERRGASIDLHTDESLGGALTLPVFARRVAGWPRAGRSGMTASAGHCVRLGTLPAEERDAAISDVLAADLGIITLPITNLYLQGWGHPVSTPRGLTAVRALLDAGARLGAGADNVRDPFNPLGRCDPFETVSLLVTAAHTTVDEAYRLVSTGARDVMRLPAAGPVVGGRAELLAVRGSSLHDVAATADPSRHVIHRGRLVASTVCTVSVAAPAPAPTDRVLA
ncbi:amidohydrolase family protein [Microbacterium sp. No. 7]|uniref:amidohydrolase family protein n=1 Tax=Microbacterium sp. No. 7 TaxID=1714373 RepID=UPI0006D19C17|nr:amidohydrolase family protein [Microbacterium sp. No. 7]ALJ22189.1 cytosine deaminase [Microbacterium sp. No. 7]